MEPTSAWISVYFVEQCQVYCLGLRRRSVRHCMQCKHWQSERLWDWSHLSLSINQRASDWIEAEILPANSSSYVQTEVASYKRGPLVLLRISRMTHCETCFHKKNKIKQKMKWIKNARKKEKDKFAIFVSFQRTVNASSTSGRLMVIPVVVS